MNENISWSLLNKLLSHKYCDNNFCKHQEDIYDEHGVVYKTCSLGIGVCKYEPL